MTPPPFAPGTKFRYRRADGAYALLEVLFVVYDGLVVTHIRYRRTLDDGTVTYHTTTPAEWVWTDADDVQLRDAPFHPEPPEVA